VLFFLVIFFQVAHKKNAGTVSDNREPSVEKEVSLHFGHSVDPAFPQCTVFYFNLFQSHMFSLEKAESGHSESNWLMYPV